MNTGFLYINKPAGVSSFWVVKQIRYITKVKRVGHAGTLDPFATGLLIVAVGRESTKHLGKFLKKDKAYRAILKLGCESTTGDTEGVVTEKLNIKIPTISEIDVEIKKFIGEIEQTPPAHSALKVGGVPAYKLARKGEKVEMKKRMITTHSLRVLEYNYPELKIEASVSSGTYIRTLGEDIGRALGTGAYLTQLERVSIDDVLLKESVSLEELNENNWHEFLRHS